MGNICTSDCCSSTPDQRRHNRRTSTAGRRTLMSSSATLHATAEFDGTLQRDEWDSALGGVRRIQEQLSALQEPQLRRAQRRPTRPTDPDATQGTAVPGLPDEMREGAHPALMPSLCVGSEDIRNQSDSMWRISSSGVASRATANNSSATIGMSGVDVLSSAALEGNDECFYQEEVSTQLDSVIRRGNNKLDNTSFPESNKGNVSVGSPRSRGTLHTPQQTHVHQVPSSAAVAVGRMSRRDAGSSTSARTAVGKSCLSSSSAGHDDNTSGLVDSATQERLEDLRSTGGAEAYEFLFATTSGSVGGASSRTASQSETRSLTSTNPHVESSSIVRGAQGASRRGVCNPLQTTTASVTTSSVSSNASRPTMGNDDRLLYGDSSPNAIREVPCVVDPSRGLYCHVDDSSAGLVLDSKQGSYQPTSDGQHRGEAFDGSSLNSSSSLDSATSAGSAARRRCDAVAIVAYVPHDTGTSRRRQRREAAAHNGGSASCADESSLGSKPSPYKPSPHTSLDDEASWRSSREVLQFSLSLGQRRVVTAGYAELSESSSIGGVVFDTTGCDEPKKEVMQQAKYSDKPSSLLPQQQRAAVESGAIETSHNNVSALNS